MYCRYIKRILDVILSLFLIVCLLPLEIILILIGMIIFEGKPFFIQARPGRIDEKSGEERVFYYIKLKTMKEIRGEDGEFLPDEKRMGRYGRFIRSISFDEIFSLINVIKGEMSIVGPRPLLVKYLPLYTKEQRQRHQVRPGITGLAQISGRNEISFEERFDLDLQYISNITFLNDFFIVLKTIKTVLSRKGIHSKTSVTMEEFLGTKEV